MTDTEFNTASKHLGISRAAFCRLIGISLNTGTAYSKGRYPVPLTVALAIAAVMRGLKPWPN
jgi:DNA-binding XRE family transcriptional regulator